MSRMRRPRAISIHFLILWALLAAAPGVVFAQAVSVGMPENAHARSYGTRHKKLIAHALDDLTRLCDRAKEPS